MIIDTIFFYSLQQRYQVNVETVTNGDNDDDGDDGDDECISNVATKVTIFCCFSLWKRTRNWS